MFKLNFTASEMRMQVDFFFAFAFGRLSFRPYFS